MINKISKISTSKDKTPKKGLKLAVNIATWTIFGIIFLAVLSVLIQSIMGVPPNIFGYRFYFVLTSSMSPELEPGDVILSKLYNDQKNSPEIEVGDVVTYIIPEGQPREGFPNTHKVITAPYEDGGKTYIVTKGVNNVIADPPTPIENVQAVMVNKSTFMSKLYGLFIGGNTLLIILFIVPFLFIIGSLVYRLVVTLKAKPAPKIPPEDDEEYKKKVIEDYLKKKVESNTDNKSMEDYLKKNDESNTDNTPDNNNDS